MEGLTPSKKILAGLLLAAAGLLVISSTSLTKSKPTSIQAAGTPDITTDWTATKLLAIHPSNADGWTGGVGKKTWFAIGPAEWQVVYKESGVATYKETWSLPVPSTAPSAAALLSSCFQSANACDKNHLDANGAGIVAESFLWGTVLDPKTPNGGDITLNFDVLGPNDPKLFATRNPNPNDKLQYGNRGGRGLGQGTVVEDANGRGNLSYYTTGAYGWIFGEVDAGSVKNSGVAIPLKWHVDGYFCDGTTC